MRTLSGTILLAVSVAAGPPQVAAQNLPAPDDTRHSSLRDAMLGLLPPEATIPDTQARHYCLPLPVDPPNDRLLGPHGDSLLATRCDVVEYQVLGPESPARWFTAQYRWRSLFSAEDTARGPSARDTVTENETVVLDVPEPGQVRAVWHARFETGSYAIWASITPELASPSGGTTLLSVMRCVNGTGGCSQEFLQQHSDGHWAPVWQVWLDHLPPGFADRILHGVRIDPGTLRGEAGFYQRGDANCCPSDRLLVQLALRGDSLTLDQQTVVPIPPP